MTSRFFAMTAIVVMSLALGGCDKCGTWLWQSKSCSGETPRQG